jgi:hypothetical protein
MLLGVRCIGVGNFILVLEPGWWREELWIGFDVDRLEGI